MGSCKANLTGPLCENCAAFYYRIGTNCELCPQMSSAVLASVLACVGAAVVVGGLYRALSTTKVVDEMMRRLRVVGEIGRKFGLMAKLKILIAFLQIFTSIPELYSVKVRS